LRATVGLSEKVHLTDLNLNQIIEQLVAMGEAPYRARQVYAAVYRSLATDFEGLTALPEPLRKRLGERFQIRTLLPRQELVSADGLTKKVLFLLRYGETIESVLMLYAGRGDRKGRATVCASTQVGCAMGCAFCATGQMGFIRHLSAGEIVEQVLHFAREMALQGRTITNVIFAGMGEPLANYDNTWEAVERLNDAEGFGLGARHMTISTVGLVPAIAKLARERLQVGLAVSLHAPDNSIRASLMPVNRRYPLEQLLPACAEYSAVTGRRVSFEYILIAGLNASLGQAQRLGELLRGMLCHVNLIPVNPVPGSTYRRPGRQDVLAFQEEVRRHGVATTLRLERGVEIQAACGQLRARYVPA